MSSPSKVGGGGAKAPQSPRLRRAWVGRTVGLTVAAFSSFSGL